MSLGELLRKLREARGWAQEDLAVEMESLGAGDVDRSTVSRWETGKRFPSPEMLALLVRALDPGTEEERQLRLAAAREKGYLLSGHEAPFQVPRDIPYFVGREMEIAHLESALGTGQIAAICGIAGMGGIGKSALAAHFAFVHRDLFPDGVLYASLRDSDPTNALLSFAAAYGVSTPPAADLATHAAAVRTALSDKHVLVVLDNAEDVGAVRQVLSGCSHSNAVLVTTRDNELAAAVASGPVLCLPVLTAEESLALLGNLVGSDALAGEHAAREVVALLGYLPLAVEIAGRLAGLRGWGMAELLTRLRNEHTRLQVLCLKDLQVRASFELSYEMLEQERQALFATLGAFRGISFAATDANALAGVDTGPGLEHLCNLSLLWAEGKERFRQHPLLAAFALEKLRQAGQEESLLDRHARYYLDVAAREDEHLQHAETIAEARMAFESNFAQIQAGQEWVMRKGTDEAVARFALALRRYFNLTGLYRTAVEWNNVGIAAVRRLGRQGEEIRLLQNLGSACANLGEMQKAIECFEQALEVARQVGDRQGEGDTLGHLGRTYYRLGQVGPAARHYEEALQIARKMMDRQGEGTLLGNLGVIYVDLGEMDEAIRCHERALSVAHEISDRRMEASNLGNLGSVSYFRGDLVQATEYYRRALAANREIGDRRGEAISLGNLGLVYADIEDIHQAIESHQQALAIDQEIGYRWGEEADWGNLGLVYARSGKAGESEACFERALAVAREIGDRQGEGVWLGWIGQGYAEQQNLQEAIQHYELALSIAQEVGNQQDAGKWLSVLGDACFRLGDIDRARSFWQSACQVLEPFSGYAEAAYDFAGATLGLAVSDRAWRSAPTKEALLAPTLIALQSALSRLSVPGVVRAFLRSRVWPLQQAGIEGLENLVRLLEAAWRKRPGR